MLTRRAFAAASLAALGAGCRGPAAAPALLSIVNNNLAPLRESFNRGFKDDVRILTLLSPT